MPERGIFIVIEGIDGCGKSTQVERLSHRMCLRGAATTHLQDPGSGAGGQAIREILRDKEIALTPGQETLLFTAARASVAEQARKSLRQGVHVICDRWLLSTIVYQSEMGHVLPGAIMDLHETFVGLDPDICIMLHTPPEVARARLCQDAASKDRFESRDEEWWSGLDASYLRVARELELPIVNGNQLPDRVEEAILKICSQADAWPDNLAKF